MRRFRIHAMGWFLFFLGVSPGVFAQRVCFQTVEAPPWTGINIGDFKIGASRPVDIAGVPRGSRFELCSLSSGFGDQVDQARFLYEGARANFEFVARLESLDGLGLGGVMSRVEPRLDSSAYLQISASQSAAGGILIQSSARLDTGVEGGSFGTKPVAVGLPIYLRVSRLGPRVSTAYSRDGQTFTTHLELDADGTDLAFLFQRVGMAQASGTPSAPSVATFAGPRIRSEESSFPPTLLAVDPSSSPLEGGIEVTILGERLEDASEVSLAGIPARIIEASAGKLVVIAGASKSLVSGDVEVVTKRGSEVLEDAFSYFGRKFIRGDFNGSGSVDLSDAVANLNFLFLGGTRSTCAEGADINGDGKGDLADSVYLLGHLFLGTKAPPAPFPLPGLPTLPSLPCDLPDAPVIQKISQETLGEDDVFTLFGDGFSPDPERNIVYFGGVQAEVLGASTRELKLRMGKIPSDVTVSPSVAVAVQDIGILIKSCKASACLTLVATPIYTLSKLKVKLVGSRDATSAGESSYDPRAGVLALSLPRKLWDPDGTYDMSANLLLPAVQGLSRGSRSTAFEFSYYGGDVSYEEWLDALARRFEKALLGGGATRELKIDADAKGEQIFFRLNKSLLDVSVASVIDSSVIAALLRPPVGRCGTGNLHPVNDRRAFGWCRFEELIDTCNGIPKWEYFIPKSKVLSASGNIFPLASPNSISPSTKTVLYNKPAYCFVRNEELWNKCKLEELESSGHSQVPHFPRSAIVIKTSWRTAASLPASPNPDNTYYHYDYNGTRQYLVAFHFTTKDVDKWFWADFYVPASAGGLGGCGGSNSDRPASITGVWTNYYMCTNLEANEEICGNSVFPECGVSTCVNCHKHSPAGDGPFGTGASYQTMGLDFLFSLNDGVQDPPGCP